MNGARNARDIDRPQPRRIWLCADDYGISSSVNTAIRDLVVRGHLNATSVLVVAPSFHRSEAIALPLTGEPPHADVTFHPRSDGRNFIVVSGEPDGAGTIVGATRAVPIWIGPNAPCESDLAEVSAQSFPRFVALDGFVEKKAILAARRKRGRMIALAALALGSLLETLLLLRAAREGRKRLRQLQDAIVEGLPCRRRRCTAPTHAFRMPSGRATMPTMTKDHATST